MLGLPAGVAFAAGFVLLDFAGYIKHRADHALPVLWQLHVVHHSDADMDVGTCLRHHPGDYLLDILLTAATVLLLGAPVDAVLAYFVLTTIHNPLRHGNIALPARLDAVLRPIIVTPDWPECGHEAMVLGLEYFRDPAENRLLAMLTQPLRQPKAREQRPDRVTIG